MLTRTLAWLGGWRVDLDGWIVRARRTGDPDLADRPDLGFIEESAIAVRSLAIARAIDRGCLPVQPDSDDESAA